VSKADVDLGLEACDAACRLALEETSSAGSSSLLACRTTGARDESDTEADAVTELSSSAAVDHQLVEGVKRLTVAAGSRVLDSDDDDEEEEDGSGDSDDDSSSKSCDSYVMEPACGRCRGDGGGCMCSERARGSVSE
jgi:hypothetical protein